MLVCVIKYSRVLNMEPLVMRRSAIFAWYDVLFTVTLPVKKNYNSQFIGKT